MIAGPKHMNDAAAVRAMIEAGELDEKEPELESQRKLGKKMYWWCEAWNQAKDGVRDSSKVTAKVEMKPEEFQEVKDHIVQNHKQPVKRKQVTPVKEVDPNKKRRQQAVSKRSTKLRAVKTKLDSVHNELNGMIADTSKLASKGYPQQMQDWCRTKIKAAMDEIWEPVQEKYNTEAVRTLTDMEPIEAIETCESSWDKELQSFTMA